MSLSTKILLECQQISSSNKYCRVEDTNLVNIRKGPEGNRKQFLIVDGKTVYAFVKKGEKFAACSSFSDRTCDVKCKVRTIQMYIE